MFKLGRYTRSLSLIGRVIRAKHGELLATLAVGILLLTMASIVMFELEHDAQPTVFTSVPAAMWWGVVTFTTVGYGDVFPVTPLGKLFGAAAAVIGVGLFALPAGILGSGFVEEIRSDGVQRDVCPHCGREIVKAA